MKHDYLKIFLLLLAIQMLAGCASFRRSPSGSSWDQTAMREAQAQTDEHAPTDDWRMGH